MQNSKMSDWQHPFVDIFKRFDTYERTQAFKGSVSAFQDLVIARKCLRLTGATPSNSTVTIPSDGNMELTGRYLYFQLLPTPGKYFVIRVQIGLKDREPGVRFVLTNMQKQYQVQGGNTLKIPLHGNEKNQWNIYCIDIQHHLEKYGLIPKTSNLAKGNYYVKKIQICANMTIRGIYTSDNVYDWTSLPKQMCFKVVKGQKWDEFYNFQYSPEEIKPSTVRQNKRRQQQEEEQDEPIEQQLQVVQKQPLVKQKPTIQSFPEEQLLDLSYALAFSPLYNPDLILYENKLCYSSGSLIVWKDLQTSQQDFLLGHTDYLIAMDANEDWLVTAQRGAKAIIRIWIGMKCVSSFQAPFEKVQQVRLNKTKHLAMVGLDTYNRQVIMIFDLSKVALNKKPEFIAKQISDFNILTLKWSPVQTDKLVSCGRQNIRFWRIKNQHLPGSPVILNHHARNTVFNVLDFERCYDEPNPMLQLQKVRKVYVGSQQGLLFQVNYHTHELEEVFKLHEGGICSIALSTGFCVTGGEDQAIRVWPMDFTQYILQAEHEGAVTSLTIAEDGIHVACGTSTGGLGILDLGTHNYRAILRSHTDTLTQVVYHTYSNSLITLSEDLTIRLWDPQKLEQTYEFTYPKQDPCTCISGNPLGLFFAAGFKSGILRIFDIENTGILEQLKNHNSEILYIEYSPDGKFLIVIDSNLAMLYSPIHGHQPIKHLPIDMPSKIACASFSPDSQTLAIIGDSATHVDLWNTSTLQLIGKIFTGKTTTKVVFSQNGDLWCIFEDCSVRRYNIQKLTIQVQMSALHRGSIKGISFDLKHHILFTIGQDSLLKLWDYSFQREPHQAYIGHVGAINGVLCVKGKVWTIGSEGLFLWKINKQLPKFSPSYVKSRPANFIKAPPQKEKNLSIIEESSNHLEGQQVDQNVDQDNVQNKGPILFSQKMRKKVQEQVIEDVQIVKQLIPMTFEAKEVTFRKSKKRQNKNRTTLGLSQIQIKHKLPFNHMYTDKLDKNQTSFGVKINTVKQNPSTFEIKYLIGNDSYGHDNLVWNWVMGWFAYTLDNLLIVDILGKDRIQKIIPMPQKLGQLLVSKDFKKLFVSSAFNPSVLSEQKDSSQVDSVSSMAAKSQQGQFANIYVFNRSWEVQRKLSFHSRGVQGMAISNDSKYLVSIGNFRQCTVCVWDVNTGKLRASNYTLDKLNDVKISDYAGRGLQFATVGRDQINFWTFSNNEQSLQYQDVFIPKTKQGNLVEITTCEYIDPKKLMVGLTNGQILIVSTESHKILLNRLICNNCSEITVMKELAGRILVGTMTGDLNILDFGSVVNDAEITNVDKISFGSPIMSICFDPDDAQGLVGTSEGVYFANMKQKFNNILIGSYTSPIILSKIIDDTLFLTAHQNSQVKLWNLQAGVLIKTYKWKNPCTACHYDPTIQKIYCFINGGKQIKLINLKRFSKDQIYDAEGINDSITQISEVQYGQLKAKWAFTSKGDVYAFELIEEKKKKSVKAVKVLELDTGISGAIPVSDKNLLFIQGDDGFVSTYTIQTLQNRTKYGISLVDKVSFADQKAEGVSIYNSKKVHIAVHRGTGQTFFAVTEDQPFVYLRNFMKRITLSKILLSSIPRCINIVLKKEGVNVIIGVQDGSLNIIDAFEPEKRFKLSSVVNSPVQNMLIGRKNEIVLVQKNACAIYNI